jgi:hypothetical protein
MSTEWNEETVRPHMFTDVEFSSDNDTWFRDRLCGFFRLRSNRFITCKGDVHSHMRLMKPAELREDKNLKLELEDREFDRIEQEGRDLDLKRLMI